MKFNIKKSILKKIIFKISVFKTAFKMVKTKVFETPKMFLKKIVLLTLLLSSFSAAADLLPNLYLGLEGQYHYYKMEQNLKAANGGLITRGNGRPLFQENNIAGAIFLGTSLFDLVAIEAGYAQFKNSHTNDHLVFNMISPGVSSVQVQSINHISARHHNGYIDLIGCFPFPLFDLIGSVGGGCLTSRVNNNIEANAFVAIPPQSQSLAGSSILTGRTTEVGLRLGLGTQCKLGEVGARFMIRYQKGNAVIRNIISANLGLFYQFF